MLPKVVQQNGAHQCIHHQSNIILSRYSSQSCNIIRLALPANDSAPEKAQYAQSSANEKSSSSTGTIQFS